MPKITFISDTHNQHNKVKISDTDILIHAGDATGKGTLTEVTSFLNWLSQQPAKQKIYVAGNHDFLFEEDLSMAKMILSEYPTIKYLEDSMVEVLGLKIWGSPHQPIFYNWAFNKTEEKLSEIWSNIPSEIDILVTHGPPLGILDRTRDGRMVGCKSLADNVLNRIKPKIHHFGHIHESYGTAEVGGIKFINSSICTLAYRPDNKPIIIDL
jgi:Icc-related predicted phosphoesterase